MLWWSAVCCNRALRGSCRGSVWSELLHSLAVAVTEALEVVVGAQFGQKSNGSRPVAVIEPLEVVVRAQLGQKCCGGRPVAVTEALEVVVGARLGQK